MRFLAFVSAFVGVCASMSSVYAAGTVDFEERYAQQLSQVQSQIARYASDPYLGDIVKTVLSRFPEYRSILLSGMREVGGVTIDVALQSHSYPGATYQDGQRALSSQARIKDLLENQRYDVIGYEGSQLDSLSFDALLDDAVLQMQTQGIIVSRTQLEGGLIANLPYDGVLMHLSTHPSAYVMGVEDLALNQLHDAVLHHLQMGYGVGTPVEELNHHLSSLRSDLAVAKITLKLKGKGKTRAVLPIGYLHESHLRELYGTLGIAGNFIDLR